MIVIPTLVNFYGSVSAPQIRVPVANTVPPVISGTAQVGQTLICSTGAWVGEPIQFAFAWKANGVVVGTNASSYVVQPSDVGKTITCTVTASATNGDSASATSATTATVTDQPGPLPDPGGGTGTLAIGSRLVLVGDSNTQWDYAGNGYSRRIFMYTGGRFRCPPGGNRGAQGTQTSYGVADIPTVIALNPDVVTIMYGTNDGGNTSDITSGYNTMINAYKAAGIRVVAIGTPQRLDESTNSTCAAVNAYLAARSDVLDGTVKHIDPSTLFTAAEVTGGTHLGEAAHDKLARGVAAVLDSMAVAGDAYSEPMTDNAAVNWFNGTGGSMQSGFSGTLPNGWTTQNAFNQGSVLCEKIVRSGRNTLKLTFTGSNAGTSSLACYFGVSVPAYAENSVADGYARLQLEGDSPDQLGIAIVNRALMTRPYTMDISLTPEEFIWRGEEGFTAAGNTLGAAVVMTLYNAKVVTVYLSDMRMRIRPTP